MIADLRRALGRVASKLYPGLDEALWNRRRNTEMAGLIASGGYELALRDLGSVAGSRPAHLVVVPQVGPEADTWKAAGGNFFYEIAQGARETYGAERVTIFGVAGDEPAHVWHQRLIRFLIESGATHLIAQVEADPNSGQQLYSWDVFWSQLHSRWDGVLLGLVTDSYFTWITAGVRRLARMSDRFMLVDICMPMDGVLVRGRPEVGPVNMPVSDESLAVIDGACDGLERRYDVTFIGTLYPYRVELLDALRAQGASVAVNPHRAVPAEDYASSRADVPDYVDYMRALAQSRMTINFSQTNAGPQQQLKTRVLEAAAMGCLVLTDDVDRTDRFWTPEVEYGFFAGPSELPGVVDAWLSDPARLEQARLAGQAKARAINVSSFWGGIDEGLQHRGLRPLRGD